MYVHTTILLCTIISLQGGEGPSNPATPSDGGDHVDEDGSFAGDTSPGTCIQSQLTA